MGLVTPQDLLVAVSAEKETTLGVAIATPTWLRLPTIDARPNLDQAEAKANENRVGAGDEFPTESRILRWTNEITLVFEANVESLDYFITRFMGVNSRTTIQNTVPADTHDESTPGWIDVSAAGRTPVTFNMLIDDGVEKRLLLGCAVQRINIPVPELDRIPVEVTITALDNVASSESMPAADQAVTFIYANDATFTSLGVDLIATNRLRSFNLTLEQDIPREVQYVIGGGFRTAGSPESGAVPKRMIFANRRVTASFVALYDVATEIDSLRSQLSGALDATFSGAAIPASSPAAKYQLKIHCPKIKYRTGSFATVGPLRTVDIAAFLLKETAAGADQNIIFKPTIETVLSTAFTFV